MEKKKVEIFQTKKKEENISIIRRFSFVVIITISLRTDERYDRSSMLCLQSCRMERKRNPSSSFRVLKNQRRDGMDGKLYYSEYSSALYSPRHLTRFHVMSSHIFFLLSFKYFAHFQYPIFAANFPIPCASMCHLHFPTTISDIKDRHNRCRTFVYNKKNRQMEKEETRKKNSLCWRNYVKNEFFFVRPFFLPCC